MKKGFIHNSILIIAMVGLILFGSLFIINISTSANEAVGDEDSGMDLPSIENKCIVDTDKVVSKHKYLEYVKDASAMAWHNGRVCYIKVGGIDEVPTNTEVVVAMKKGQAGLIDFVDDLCTVAGTGFDVPDEGVFIWKGDIGYCDNGVLKNFFTTLLDVSKAFKAAFSPEVSIGELRDTLYLYSTEKFCRSDVLENNNYERYSQTRGTYNNNLCVKNNLGLPEYGGDHLLLSDVTDNVTYCITNLSVTEEFNVLISSIDAEVGISSPPEARKLVKNLYIDNYDQDKIKSCGKYSYGYKDNTVKVVADEIEAEINSGTFKIDHNKPIVSTYSDGLCKFDVGDWANSMSPEESCVYIIVDGVWVKPSEIYKYTGKCDFEIRMFYKYEKENQGFGVYINSISNYAGVESADETIPKAYELAFENVERSYGLDDIIIEFTTKSGNPKPGIVGPDVPEGELNPDDCVPTCMYGTQFCCDKGAGVKECQSSGCSGVTYPWTKAIYNKPRCENTKTYLYCYVGGAWDESTTEYTLPHTIKIYDPSNGNTITTAIVTGEILLNGGGGDGTIITGNSLLNIISPVIDPNKKYAYIPEEGVTADDFMLLNQDSINLIVDEDGQLTVDYRGNIDILI